MRSKSERRARSLRQASARSGLSREFLSELVRAGRLPGLRRGRAILVLDEDVDRVFRELAKEQRFDPEVRVAAVLGLDRLR